MHTIHALLCSGESQSYPYPWQGFYTDIRAMMPQCQGNNPKEFGLMDLSTDRWIQQKLVHTLQHILDMF